MALGRAGAGKVKQGAGKAVRGVAVAAGAAASTVGVVALAANQLLKVATSFESYNIQLETLEGSSEKGRKAMAWISDFAARTPLELDQVVESYRNLKTFGLDPTDGTLQALVDTMAASGKGAEQLEGLTLALGQAWTKGKLQGEEALQLLERGVPVWDILSQKYGKTAAELQDLASKGKLGREAIRLLIEEIGRRNAGASDKMARTWTGMVSNLSDAWTRFALAIMDAGLFDWMKGKLQMVLDTVNRMAGDGTLQAWAARVSARIIRVLEAAWSFATRTYAILSRLGGYLAVAADTVGGWENLAMILAGLAFASTLIGTAAGLVQIAVGLAMLGAALLANPILLLIAAIVAGAVAIYVYWEPIKAFFADMWNAIADGAQAAWGRIKAFFAGLWNAIGPRQAAGAIKAFFAGCGTHRGRRGRHQGVLRRPVERDRGRRAGGMGQDQGMAELRPGCSTCRRMAHAFGAARGCLEFSAADVLGRCADGARLGVVAVAAALARLRAGLELVGRHLRGARLGFLHHQHRLVGLPARILLAGAACLRLAGTADPHAPGAAGHSRLDRCVWRQGV